MIFTLGLGVTYLISKRGPAIIHLYFIFYTSMSDIGQNPPHPVGHLNIKAKSSRKKRSWTWDYFEDVDIKEQTSDKGEPLKRCKIIDANENKCGTIYVNDGSTGNAINHLLNDHEISKEGKRDKVGTFH